MRIRPIVFSADAVKAILAGEKTQTRRIISVQPPRKEDFRGSDFGLSRAVAPHIKMYSQNDYDRLPKHPTDWELIGSVGVASRAGFKMEYRCPFGQVGDQLWVRESFGTSAKCPASLIYLNQAIEHIAYRADKPEGNWCWKASIHMPYWASRIRLEILNIKAQQIQSISGPDICAEGIKFNRLSDGPPLEGDIWQESKQAFESLWNATYKGEGQAWDANPWVWAVEFKVMEVKTCHL